MKIAVVILNWNGKALLEQFLPAVIKHSPEAKIYVADNASEDDSVAFIGKNFPQVCIIKNRVNGGFAKGYNDALKYVDEDILILLNSDVETTPGWIPPLLEEFEKDSRTGSVQPKILDYRRRGYFEYAGAAGGFLDQLGYPYCRGRIFNSIEKDEGQYDEPAEVFWTSGACMAIRKSAFHQAGEFDEDFFAHQEEIDLCWRMNKLGWKQKVTGRSHVFHLGGGTLGAMQPRKTFYNFRNSLYCLVKNVPGKNIWWLLLLRLFLDGIAGLKFIFELKPSHTAAIIQAHFSFYSKLGKMIRKRKKNTTEKRYFRIKSIVLAYYLMRRRRFEDL